jgi:hypothetical protein
MSEPNDAAGKPSELRIKEIIAALAVGSILAGCAVYLMQEQLGIPRDTARLISLVFVLAAIADGAILVFWDRLFKRRE